MQACWKGENMKLSKLVFECVRDSITLPNVNMNYVSFVNGDYDNTKDYINQISGVFGALNLALSRLYDNNKTLFQVKDVEIENNEFLFNDGEIVNIVLIKNSNYKHYEFRSLKKGKDRYVHILGNDIPKVLTVEYKPAIPHFDKENMTRISLDQDNETIVVDNNIELEDYGITDAMCSYLKEFVEAQLTEYIDPVMSNNHNNRAEQYFQTIKQATTSFYQPRICNKEKFWL